MERCDVLIVGGGPAGSTCARELVLAGLDVIVADKASFPRDKICAGWITPAVVTELGLDLDDYAQGRTLDPIVGFRVGRMGDRVHHVRYDRPVSYGIRRCEFDHYLLAASGARVVERKRLDRFERRDNRWIAGGEFDAAVLVGAGGHFCPVARAIGGAAAGPVITAEEVEFSAEEDELGGCDVESGVPELYYTADLAGYGWAFRKQGYLNIGIGVRSNKAGGDGAGRLADRIDDFLSFLQAEHRIGRAPRKKMSGHAYLLRPDSRRSVAGEGYVLVGDSAGLAYDRSGEGIRPAVESGLLAARSIRRVFYASDDGAPASRDCAFADYATAIDDRFGAHGFDPASFLPPSVLRGIATTLMSSEWFSRRVLLERWFLHAHEQPLAA